MSGDVVEDVALHVRALLGAGAGVPQIERLLSDGYTNRNFLVRLTGERVVVRIGNPRAAELGIDRTTEERIWRAAAASHLSPALLAFEPAQGDAISEFVDLPSVAELSVTSALPTLTDTAGLGYFATALRRTHALELPCPAADPADLVARYIKVAHVAGAQWPDWVERVLERVRRRARPAVLRLTHHDFNPWNLLWRGDEAPWVIDWEYAALGDPMFDLVTLSAHLGLDAQARAELLRAYVVQPSTVDAATLARLPELETLFHLREYAWAGAMRALGDRNPNVEAQWQREGEWLRANAPD